MNADSERSSSKSSGLSLPVLMLTLLGTVIAVLGLFVAGNIVMTGIGLGAIFGAGVIGLLERLVDSRRP